MKSVKFGEKHTYQEWGLILTHTGIGFPNVKKETIDIPRCRWQIKLYEKPYWRC